MNNTMRPTKTNASITHTSARHTFPICIHLEEEEAHHSSLTDGSDSRVSTQDSMAPPPPTTINPPSTTVKQHQLGSPDKQRQHTSIDCVLEAMGGGG